MPQFNANRHWSERANAAAMTASVAGLWTRMQDRVRPALHSKDFPMNLQEIKIAQKEALTGAEAVVKAAEARGSGMTALENEQYEKSMNEYRHWGLQGQKLELKNTLSMHMNVNGVPKWLHDPDAFTGGVDAQMVRRMADASNPEYSKALYGFISTGGKEHGEALTPGADGYGGYHVPGSESFTRQRKANGSFAKSGMNAATYEGTEGSSGAAGGFAVNVLTEQNIAELALPDLGIFNASMVIPTAFDVKVPVQASFGTSAIKAESTGTVVATFGGTDPTLGQITLSAFMCGAQRTISWELTQDVPSFQSFVLDDLLKAQRIAEGQFLATGSGTAQAQGVFGNTGTGTGTAYELTGAATDGQILLNSLFDVTSTLKGVYQANASWIMSRATGLAIRRAQMQANLFIPVATVDADGTERILGKPVFYDVNAPALPTATTAGVLPILFGDFKAGYLIGVRGGGGINVKMLDQPLATQGQLVIIAYRRLDGRVRMTEAIQSVKVSHS
jgi:HK97 family phage major capsid protein